MVSDPNNIPLGAISDAGAQKPERRDAAANRMLIMETAVRLFDERSVSDVSMADIAQAAGVGKGTLYRRFANKGELCLALMDAQMTDFQERMLAQMRQLSASGAAYLEQLDAFLDALVYFTETHQPLLCEVQREGLFQSSTEHTMPHFWQYMTVSGLLRRAQATAEIDPELDVEYLADAILSPIKIDIFRFQREVRGFSLERISSGLRSMARALGNVT